MNLEHRNKCIESLFSRFPKWDTSDKTNNIDLYAELFDRYSSAELVLRAIAEHRKRSIYNDPKYLDLENIIQELNPKPSKPTFKCDYPVATSEEKLRILKEASANGNDMATLMLNKKQLDPIRALGVRYEPIKVKSGEPDLKWQKQMNLVAKMKAEEAAKKASTVKENLEVGTIKPDLNVDHISQVGKKESKWPEYRQAVRELKKNKGF